MPPKKAAKKSASSRASLTSSSTKRSKLKTSAARKSKPDSKLKSLPSADFASIFASLREVMASHGAELHATADEPRKYYLVTKSKSWKGAPMFFGAVIWSKAYVSYHLMPLYIFPELKKSVSPDLKRRMQGKTCFNFRQHDSALFTELSELTHSGLEAFRQQKFL